MTSRKYDLYIHNPKMSVLNMPFSELGLFRIDMVSSWINCDNNITSPHIQLRWSEMHYASSIFCVHLPSTSISMRNKILIDMFYTVGFD